MGREDNLIPYKPGQTGNPNGRPPKLAKALKSIPKDAQERIYGVLFTALTFKNVKEAMEYIREQESTEIKYGFVLQIAIKALAGKNGFLALMDIMDRLFGKPRIQAEVSHSGGYVLRIDTDSETKANIEGGLG